MSTSPVANSSEEEIRTNVLVLMVEAYSRVRLKSSNRLYLACSPGPTRWNPDGLETGVAGEDHEPRGGGGVAFEDDAGVVEEVHGWVG